MVLKNFNISEMRQSATFCTNAPSALGQGQQDGYVSFLTTRCRLRAKRGNRALDLGLVEQKDQFEMICRFDSALDPYLRADVKIIIDSQTYTIDSWGIVDQIKHWYQFILNVATTSLDPNAILPGIGTFIVG